MTLYQRAKLLTFTLFGGALTPQEFEADLTAKPEKWTVRLGVIYEQLKAAKDDGRKEKS